MTHIVSDTLPHLPVPIANQLFTVCNDIAGQMNQLSDLLAPVILGEKIVEYADKTITIQANDVFRIVLGTITTVMPRDGQ